MATVSEVLVKDARMCARNAVIALDTSIATLDRDGSPTRTLSQGYTANRVLTLLRDARADAKKAEELLATLEEGGAKPDV